MVGDKVAGAIMTEFLRNLELNQQDMGSAEKNTKKYKSVKVPEEQLYTRKLNQQDRESAENRTPKSTNVEKTPKSTKV